MSGRLSIGTGWGTFGLVGRLGGEVTWVAEHVGLGAAVIAVEQMGLDGDRLSCRILGPGVAIRRATVPGYFMDRWLSGVARTDPAVLCFSGECGEAMRQDVSGLAASISTGGVSRSDSVELGAAVTLDWVDTDDFRSEGSALGFTLSFVLGVGIGSAQQRGGHR